MRYTLDEQLAAIKKVRDEKVKERDKYLARPVKGSPKKIKPLIRLVMILNQVAAEMEIANVASKASKEIQQPKL